MPETPETPQTHPGYGLGPAVRVDERAPWWRTALFALLFIGGGSYFLSRTIVEDTRISWKCAGKLFGRVGCTFTAEKGHGRVCVELVWPCADGTHRRELCSPPLHRGASGSADTTLAEFSPPLAPGDLEHCQKLTLGEHRFVAQ